MVSYIHEYGGRENAATYGACPTEIGPNSGVMSNLYYCYRNIKKLAVMLLAVCNYPRAQASRVM